MDSEKLDKATIEELSAELVAQMKAPLDKRDSELAARLEKAVDDKVKAAIEADRRDRARFEIPGVGKVETAKFSFGKLLKGMITRDFKGADAEFEHSLCLEAAKQKDMAAGVDTTGGFLVPAQVLADQIIPLLQAEAIASQLGAPMWTGLTGSPVLIPKVTSGTTAYWVGEAPSAGVTESDMGFGQMEMRPHTLAATTRLSNRLIMLSTPAADQMVQTQLRKDISLALDLAYFNGSGVSNQPLGILQSSGLGSVSSATAASADTTYDNLIEMQYKLMAANAFGGSLGWAMHPAVLREFWQMKDPADASQPKQRRLFAEKPISQVLLNFNFKTSTLLPTNTLLFGDFSAAGIGIWSNMLLKVSDVSGNNFDRLQTQVLIAMDCDIGVRRGASFCVWNNMTGAT